MKKKAEHEIRKAKRDRRRQNRHNRLLEKQEIQRNEIVEVGSPLVKLATQGV